MQTKRRTVFQTISSGVATNYCVLLKQILPLLAPIICIYSRAFRHQLNLFPSLQCDQAHPDSSISRSPIFFFFFLRLRMESVRRLTIPALLAPVIFITTLFGAS